MTMVICDLCGKEIPDIGPQAEGEPVSMTDGCAIIKVDGETWRFLDLCEDCRDRFRMLLRNGCTDGIA